MRQYRLTLLALLILPAWLVPASGQAERSVPALAVVELPRPELSGDLERALHDRRSTRSFHDSALTLAEIANLAWAAQGFGIDGVSGPTRTVPSAGATHPLEIYIAVRNVVGLPAGLYRYLVRSHSLEQVAQGDRSATLSRAALNQHFISQAPALFVITAESGRTTARYGARGQRYVFMEAGGAAQSIVMQATRLGLGSVIIGAYDDGAVQRGLGITQDPLLIIPVGRVR